MFINSQKQQSFLNKNYPQNNILLPNPTSVLQNRSQLYSGDHSTLYHNRSDHLLKYHNQNIQKTVKFVHKRTSNFVSLLKNYKIEEELEDVIEAYLLDILEQIESLDLNKKENLLISSHAKLIGNHKPNSERQIPILMDQANITIIKEEKERQENQSQIIINQIKNIHKISGGQADEFRSKLLELRIKASFKNQQIKSNDFSEEKTERYNKNINSKILIGKDQNIFKMIDYQPKVDQNLQLNVSQISSKTKKNHRIFGKKSQNLSISQSYHKQMSKILNSKTNQNNFLSKSNENYDYYKQ